LGYFSATSYSSYVGTGQTGQAGSTAQLPNQTGQAGSATGSTPQINQAGLEPARPVPLPPVQADTSSSDSAPDFVAPIVATESEDLQDGQYEELVDYEPPPERVDINVVYLSADGDFLGDNSRTAEFNFATQSAIFEKPEDSMNHQATTCEGPHQWYTSS